MFDFSWSEIALIGGVALVLIGPKDMPVAMRTVAGFAKKARSMAGEFQTHVDEMLREANLSEARDTLRSVRGMNVRSKVMNFLDDDGSLRRSVRDATAPLPPLPAQIGSAAPAAPTFAAAPTDDPTRAPVVASTDGHGGTVQLPQFATRSFVPGPFAPPAEIDAAPAQIPPRIARDIARRAMPRPDFLPPDPGRHAY